VGLFQGQGDGAHQGGRLLRRAAGVVPHPCRQRFALDEGHAQVVNALGLADVEDGADIGVLQAADRARLAVEAFQGFPLVSSEMRYFEGRLACRAADS
jgi:hypothetical protein